MALEKEGELVLAVLAALVVAALVVAALVVAVVVLGMRLERHCHYYMNKCPRQ